MEEMIRELLKRWEQVACNGMGDALAKEDYFLSSKVKLKITTIEDSQSIFGITN